MRILKVGGLKGRGDYCPVSICKCTHLVLLSQKVVLTSKARINGSQIHCVTYLWSYCKNSKNFFKKTTPSNRDSQYDCMTHIQYVPSVGYLYDRSAMKTLHIIVVAIVTIDSWAIYCVTFELHLFTRESSNFIYYLYNSCFFHHFISILNFHIVTSLFHGSLKVTCVVSDLTYMKMACSNFLLENTRLHMICE